MNGMAGWKLGMRHLAVLMLAALTAVTACARSPYKLTECINGEPAVERIHDVAPPNC